MLTACSERKLFLGVFGVVFFMFLAQAAQAVEAHPPLSKDLAWPPINRECRPWSYWWWLGSAVDQENISRELQRYHAAGWGGVHIIPIYGAKGWEDHYLSYLSPEWMAMLRYTVEAAGSRDMDVDMTLGTGWCFGGPEVTKQEAAARCVMKRWNVKGGEKLAKTVDPESTQTVMAFSSEGKSADLTGRMGKDGAVEWTTPDGDWQVDAISQRPSINVKRAAPGGEGYMLNPHMAQAVRHYLSRFEKAFDRYDGPLPRAVYHDSYEYDANWTPDLFEQFEQRRGYRLQSELPALFDKSGERAARVKSDYCETLSDMMVEDSMPLWIDWAHRRGMLTRNQAHGAPANLLDLYALADVPETEMFYRDRRILVAKFASSAAHVAGRKLTAAETGTWVQEHFTETLGELKRLADDMFLSGINHLIFHGTCYSPDDAAWPGWLFYASTELNPRNSIWRDVPALAQYIARCQSVLQAGRPDDDLLIYWPIYDVWHNPSGMQKYISIHGARWFTGQPIGRLAERLQSRGFAFDYVSDRQLGETKYQDGIIHVPGGGYRVVVVPSCEHVPIKTVKKLLALAESGADVIFEDRLPYDVPGWNRWQQRRKELYKLYEPLKFTPKTRGRLHVAPWGKGRVYTGNVEAALAACRIARETLTDHPGLSYLRRRFQGGHYYFLANRGEKSFEGWLPLATPTASAVVMDPMTGRTGVAAQRTDQNGRPEVLVQLAPNASLILRTFADRRVAGPPWPVRQAKGKPHELSGQWQVKFLEGGPKLPEPFSTFKLASWTELGDEEAQRFAGTAKYTLVFDAPPGNVSAWMLDLGKVCQSARVRLNGQDLGTLIVSPFQVRVDSLKPRDNILKVEVTNVSANRIRDLDRRKVPWKIFHDINFVTTRYQPFDASGWPLTDSGLLGPVTLTPLSETATDDRNGNFVK
ncbi:MAG: glycoside hydrolase family 2 [Pirellulales bacterium]|nr:glycoside hydrolase family 2 [Pirellulales bacterium]